MILGIDFGSKLAGTTVIAQLYEHNKVAFFSSTKGQDADAFILDFVRNYEDIWLAYIDAPLSLPAVYKNQEEDGDYFYRQADRETSAMSPMFLGGLTARAMRLKRELNKLGIQVVETYPAKLAEILGLKELAYKKKDEETQKIIEKIKLDSKFEFDDSAIKNNHCLDALLCLYSAKRHEMNRSMRFGNRDEGEIIV